MSDQEKHFIDINKKKLRNLFNCFKRKTIPRNSYQLLDWLDSILCEFFGGLICRYLIGKKSR